MKEFYKLVAVFILCLLGAVFLLLTKLDESVFTSMQGFTQQKFYRAQIVEIKKEGEETVNQYKKPFQIVVVEIRERNMKKKVTLEHGTTYSITENDKVQKGTTVVLTTYKNPDGEESYVIVDKYRLPQVLTAIGIFLGLVFIFTRKKGVGAILGMIFSLGVIVKFIVPQILNGSNPLLVTISGALVIMLVTIYLAHGFSRQTTIAVVSTFLSLIITAFLAYLFVTWSALTGATNDASIALQYGPFNINLQGLLLGGIIIGSLGILDDVTTTQAATIFELHKTNKNLHFHELVSKGMNIGREHIVSLVNTLVLAYAGASIAIFIIIVLNFETNLEPFWLIINRQEISEEIVRTIAGSIGLILAVPITTLLASWVVTKYTTRPSSVRKNR